jgi:ATP phosphoribosyltransferase
MKSFDAVLLAQSAERIAVAVGDNAEANVQAFSELTGIEVPIKMLKEQLLVTAGGVQFRAMRPPDMVEQVRNNISDIAIGSDELAMESGGTDVLGVSIPILNKWAFSLLVRAEDESRMKDELLRNRTGGRYIEAPTSLPNCLNQAASVLDLPILASSLQATGKVEPLLRTKDRERKGWIFDIAADITASGDTAKKLELVIAKELFKIGPALLVRRRDADAYQPAA